MRLPHGSNALRRFGGEEKGFESKGQGAFPVHAAHLCSVLQGCTVRVIYV